MIALASSQGSTCLLKYSHCALFCFFVCLFVDMRLILMSACLLPCVIQNSLEQQLKYYFMEKYVL